MRVDVLDPVASAAPGDTATYRLRVFNDTRGPASYRLRVVGLRDDDTDLAVAEHHVPAGAAIDVDVDVRVPRAFAPGRHALAVEVRSDRTDERPGLAGLTVEVSSIQQVTLQVIPSSLKGRLSGRFKLEIDNHETRPVDLQLAGEGPHLSVQLKRTAITLQPGERIQVKGKVIGEKRLVRSALNHVVTFSATGKSAPVYTDAGYRQRPIVPRQLRMFLAVLVIVALWAGLLGGGLYLWKTRDQRTVSGVLAAPLAIDTDGDGILDTPATGVGIAMGTGEPGADPAASAADGGTAAPAAAPVPVPVPEAKPPRLTTTTLGGTVKAGATGADGGITFSLAPVKLGDESITNAVGPAGSSRPAKIWPARYGRASQAGVSDRQMTQSIESPLSVTSDDKGVWVFPDVKIPDNYRLDVKSNGFDTQSLIVSLSDDGKPVELKTIVLQPGTGHAKGVALGPSGALGGVAITITDGTLIFKTTTSSKVGEIGQWDLPGLSTPNNYTLTAELAGYGTEVQLLPLAPGGTNLSMQINMVPGVGSIRGVAAIGDPPRGGVTLTASNADLTRTATSLTVDPQGSFNFPQLPLGVYTVTASSPGFQTQTRMVPLGGGSPENPDTVNFALSSTSASVFGKVINDRGETLVGVGIKVSNGAASIDSSTAATPTAGRFEIKDLPPGNYVVAFEMFNHAPESRTITLVAGQALDLATVTMKFRPQTVISATTTVTIPVFNTDDEPLTGATVQLLTIADGKVVQEKTDPENKQASFTMADVAIGTYTLKVTKQNYRTATKRITVGLEPMTKEFKLIRLGQVTGAIVDAFNKTRQLDGYSLKIYGLDAKGNRDGDALQVRTVDHPAIPDKDKNILWQSIPNALPTGTYEIEVVKPPAGYQVRNNQIIDLTTSGAKPMQFTISPTDEDTIRLKDLVAVPYPTLKGRLLVPLTGTVDSVSYKPLDANSSVKLSCVQGDSDVNADLTDASAGVPGKDTYVFSRATIEAHKLLGACTIKVTSSSFQTVEFSLPTPLAVSDGLTTSDQVLNIPLSPIASHVPPVYGFVQWIDNGTTARTAIQVGDVTIAPNGQVITGFTPATGALDAVPTPLRTTLAPTASLGDGAWALPGQILGTTRYNVSKDGFVAGSFDVMMTNTTNNVSVREVIQPGTNLKVSATTKTSNIIIEVEPRNRSITGIVDLISVGAKDYAGVGITKTGPTPSGPANAGTLVAPVAPNGAFSINDATPGHWSVSLTPPTHYVFDVPARAPAPFVVAFDLPPGTGAFDIPAAPAIPKMVALPSLDVRVLDAAGNDLLTSGAATLMLKSPALSTIPGSLVPAVSPDKAYRSFSDLQVNLADPLNLATALHHHLSLTATGFDLSSVSVTSTGTTQTTFGTNVSDITVDLLAGEHGVITVVLPRFGSFSGKVLGITDASNSTQELLTSPSSLVISTQRVLPDGSLGLSSATVTTNLTAHTFTVAGPPGLYKLTMTHPDFQNGPATPLPSPDDVLGYYRISNSVDAPVITTAFKMLIVKGSIDITVRDVNNDLLGGAQITVRSGTDFAGGLITPDWTTGLGLATPTVAPSLGLASVTNLFPGSYTLEIRRRSAGYTIDDLFPVLVSVNVPRGTTSAPGVVSVVATLLPVGGSIRGTIVAKNGDGKLLPFPPQISVTRTFLSGSSTVTVDGSGRTNTALDTSTTPGPGSTVGTAGDNPLTFDFTNLRFGVQRLTFSTVPGWNTPSPNPLDVPISSSTRQDLAQVSYVATPVTLKVSLFSDNDTPLDFTDDTTGVPGATVTLDDPDNPTDGTDLRPVVHLSSDPTNVYTIVGVVPENVGTNYILHVTKNLFVFPDVTVPVPVRADPTPQTLSALGNPSKLGLGGLVRKQDSSASSVPFEGATVNLYQLGGSAPGGALKDTVTTGPSGRYSFAFDESGRYAVEVIAAGYATRDTRSTPSTVNGKGTLVDVPDVTLPKYATIKASVKGTAATTAATGLNVDLVVVGGVTTACTPVTPTTPDPQVNTCVFSNLDPGDNYSLKVTATNYFDETVAAFDPAPGELRNFDVTMVARTVEVTVATEDGLNDASSAIVKFRSGTGAYVDPTSSAVSGSGRKFTLVGVPAGTGDITVSLGSYRPGISTFTAPVATKGTISASAVVLKPPVTVTVQVKNGAGADVTGATVQATSPAFPGVTRTATFVSGASYSFTGAARFGIGTWTITAFKNTVGSATGSITITANTANTANSTPSILTLIVRTMAVTFNITPSGSTISFPGATVDPTDPTRYTIAETATSPAPYTITKAGYVTVNGTVAIVANGSATVTVTMVTLPTVTFAITPSGATISFPGATVDLTDSTRFTIPETLHSPAPYTITKAGYNDATGYVTFPSTGPTPVSVNMVQLPTVIFALTPSDTAITVTGGTLLSGTTYTMPTGSISAPYVLTRSGYFTVSTSAVVGDGLPPTTVTQSMVALPTLSIALTTISPAKADLYFCHASDFATVQDCIASNASQIYNNQPTGTYTTTVPNRTGNYWVVAVKHSDAANIVSTSINVSGNSSATINATLTFLT